MRNFVLFLIILAASCAIALGILVIGVHEGWWQRAASLWLVKPLCVAMYVLTIAAAIGMVFGVHRRT